MAKEVRTPRITPDIEGKKLHINTRRLCLSRLFTAANKAALKMPYYHRNWALVYQGAVIGSIQLACNE